MYRIDILTLFDLTVGDVLSESILGRAQERGYLAIEAHQIRDYTLNKQKQVDDYPYGGGRGAVMQADPIYQCWKHVVDTYGPGHTIYFSPAGTTFCQAKAKTLAADYDHLILVCGHYEGVDERFMEECVDEEISLGDFVLTGGEIPAMAVTDAVSRLIPGVLPIPNALSMRATGMACWNIPSIPARRSGMAERCRPSCFREITPWSPNGGGSRLSSAPSGGGLICTKNWT